MSENIHLTPREVMFTASLMRGVRHGTFPVGGNVISRYLNKRRASRMYATLRPLLEQHPTQFAAMDFVMENPKEIKLVEGAATLALNSFDTTTPLRQPEHEQIRQFNLDVLAELHKTISCSATEK